MKTKTLERHLLPDEHLGSTPAHPAVKAALRRAHPALFVVWGIPLSAYFWRAARHGDWGGSLIPAAISAGFGYMLWQALITGFTRTNHGEFLRAARPIGYWLSILFFVFGYGLGIASLLANVGR